MTASFITAANVLVHCWCHLLIAVASAAVLQGFEGGDGYPEWRWSFIVLIPRHRSVID